MGLIAAALAFVAVGKLSTQRYSRHASVGRRIVYCTFIIAFFAATLVMAGSALGFRSACFGVLAAADVLGVIGLTRSWIRWALPTPLQHIRRWEAGLSISLGVKIFGQLVRRAPLRYLNRLVYVSASDRDTGRLRSHLLDAEGAHFWGLVLTAPVVILGALYQIWAMLFWLFVFHLLLNIYPFMHLRYIRRRIRVSARE